MPRVPSVEPSSTTITSHGAWVWARALSMASRTQRSALKHGMMMLTRGLVSVVMGGADDSASRSYHEDI